MSEDANKAAAPAAEAESKAPAGGKMAGIIPLVAAAAISILGSFGAGFYLNKQLLTGVNGELQKALAAVQTSGDHGDDHKGGGSKESHGTTAGHGTDTKSAAKAKDPHDTHAAPEAKKDDGHGAPAKKDDGHGGGGGAHGETAKAAPATPEALAKAAQAKAGLFALGDDPIVANPSGDSRFVVVKVTIVSVGQADLTEAISTNVDRLRDAVTAYLADQTMDTIQKRGFRSQMGAQLALAFNRILGPGSVREVIFPQFVVQ
ncbi:MAG: flagellar basal body-associated FliL family protein [Verrucomicrobiota bacterium]